MKRVILIVFVTVLMIFFSLSCRDEDFNNDSSVTLGFSADTVTFDTIFTTIGSTTKQLKLYNPHKQYVRISKIYLAGGNSSFFRLNIDGEAARSIDDIEIPPKDSLFIFIEVTIDPFGVNNPLVIKDSIVFVTNGNMQDVKLIAYGQDVHLMEGWLETQTWFADKPYLIYGNIGIDSSNILTIEKGTKIYVHNRTGIFVWGSLIINGTKDEPVIFRGDRLDNLFGDFKYDYLSGQWYGIRLYSSSKNNSINYCVIRNAEIALQVGILEYPGTAELEINNSIIHNNLYHGIFAIKSKINAKNIIVSNCGVYNVALVNGGSYEFYYSTFANYYNTEPGNSRSTEPLLKITNGLFYNDSNYRNPLIKANFNSCIIYGSHLSEFDFDFDDEYDHNYQFMNCLIKKSTEEIDSLNLDYFTNTKFNEDPMFLTIKKWNYNFSLDTLSPAKDQGNRALITEFPELEFDILGNSRLLDAGPDIGAYERIE